MALRRINRATLALPLLSVLAACASTSGEPVLGVAPGAVQPPVTVQEQTTPQPRTATYNCADGGMMTIQNLGTSLRLLGPDGVTEELPASPAGQTSRYGQSHDAIVIDGNEALVMTGGHPPMPCTR